MIKPRIYADFHNTDRHGRLRLSTVGTQEDLTLHTIELQSGLELVLYSDDLDEQGQLDELLVDGIVNYSEEERCWVATIDWNAIRHASGSKSVSKNEKCTGSLELPASIMGLSATEEKCWRKRYNSCDGIVVTKSLVFVFPKADFPPGGKNGRDPHAICQDLQKCWDHLQCILEVDPVSDKYGTRIVVGYRDPRDEGGADCNAGFELEDVGSGEKCPYINIPWGYRDRINEPVECCSHEMVHPFVASKPLADMSEKWVEGVCDFLRVPLLRVVAREKEANDWEVKFLNSAWKTANSYHDHAGRLLWWCNSRNYSFRDHRAIDEQRRALRHIWRLNLSEALSDEEACNGLLSS